MSKKENSSSRSTFPEHNSLLGNMLVISANPVWTYEDSRNMGEKWLQEGNCIKRPELARSNLGNQGRENITACDMQNYFPGTMHLALRSAETLSIQIGMCAIGKLKTSHGAIGMVHYKHGALVRVKPNTLGPCGNLIGKLANL